MATGAEFTVFAEEMVATWRQDAACSNTGNEIDFFPGRGESAEAAKAVCAQCPVQEQCLDYALRTKVAFGVWGGLSERERRRVRRSRFRATAVHARSR